jgi:ketosteroid isomerase-like protein
LPGLDKTGRIAHLDHIRSYYDALNSGDAELVASHFTDDAVHYYTRLGPHQGAERIGQNAAMGVGMIEGQWFIEHGIESGDEAVIEWTMTWLDPRSGERRLDRGTEWFRMRDGKIAEVRAYHHGGKKNPQGDLLGFDHEGRGYTMLSDWRPPPEEAKVKAKETGGEAGPAAG